MDIQKFQQKRMEEKKSLCAILIPEIENAEFMKKVAYENHEIVEQHLEIPAGLKESLVAYLQKFSDGQHECEILYNDEKEVSVYLRCYNGSEIKMTAEMDIGMKFHTYFCGAEEMLYGLFCVNEMKEQDKGKKPKAKKA